MAGFRRRVGRISLRQQMRQGAAAQRFYSGASPKPLTPDVQAAMIGPPPAAPRRAPQPSGIPPESEVINDVIEVLAVHPAVLFAVRQNSGAMPYENAAHKMVPVWFYKWAKRPARMRITDFWGVLNTGRMFALEAKRTNWTGVTDDREREQQKFIAYVKASGGIGGFVRSAAEARTILDSVR